MNRALTEFLGPREAELLAMDLPEVTAGEDLPTSSWRWTP